jgi:hypothetical protein
MYQIHMKVFYILGSLVLSSYLYATELSKVSEELIEAARNNNIQKLTSLLKEDPERSLYKIGNLTLIEYVTENVSDPNELKDVILLLEEAQTAATRKLEIFR